MRHTVKATITLDNGTKITHDVEFEDGVKGAQPATTDDINRLSTKLDRLREQIDLLFMPRRPFSVYGEPDQRVPPPYSYSTPYRRSTDMYNMPYTPPPASQTPPPAAPPAPVINRTYNLNWAAAILAFLLGVLLTAALMYNPPVISPEGFNQHVQAEQWLAEHYSGSLQEIDRLNEQHKIDQINNDIIQDELYEARRDNQVLQDQLTESAMDNDNLRVTANNLNDQIDADRATINRLLDQLDSHSNQITLPDSLTLNLNINGNLTGAGSIGSTNSASPADFLVIPWMGSLDSGAVNALGINEFDLIRAPESGKPGLISFTAKDGTTAYLYYNNPASIRQNNSTFFATLPGRYRISSWNFFHINSPVADQGESTADGNLAGLYVEPISR